MESYLHPGHYDLITPDGRVTWVGPRTEQGVKVRVFIEKISPSFVGFDIPEERLFFNIKSVLAQLGIDGHAQELSLTRSSLSAEVEVDLSAYGEHARTMLKLIEVGMYIGKLFAADQRRCLRTTDYLYRMFNRTDRWGKPLLLLGGLQGSKDLILEKHQGFTVAYLALKSGVVEYDASIKGFLPTLAKGLQKNYSARHLLALHQEWNVSKERKVSKDEILLVRTLPLHIRTVFGRVVQELLPKAYHHTRADILQPDTSASGDIYELYGESKQSITDIPLEFYTLEPHREHIFFADRDQLQNSLENTDSVFEAFSTAPKDITAKAAVFIVKGTQLLHLKESDWIVRTPQRQDFPGLNHGTRQAVLVDRYIRMQPSYPFLKNIEDGLITSQGVLLSRFLPSPLLKPLLLSYHVHDQLKGIYFQFPSLSHDMYFSQEDRALLHDLHKFGIPVYWLDHKGKSILRYIQREHLDAGLFVPNHLAKEYLTATMFGVYGSNLLEGEFEEELMQLLQGVLTLKDNATHDLLNKTTPIALITGGGPGVMEVGNRVAQRLDILSCANILDFTVTDKSVVNEQYENPHIEAKMTYRLDRLVERQAEFHLDLPIFLAGGIGTDFELSLEKVRRKVGSTPATPVLLFGSKEYWKKKISYCYQCNIESGTVKGSEWLSNCFYCIQNAKQGLWVYQQFFAGTLPIGPAHAAHQEGFVSVAELIPQ